MAVAPLQSPQRDCPQTSTLGDFISINNDASPPLAWEDDGPDLSVAEILRLRKTLQRRKGGIEFTNTALPLSSSPSVPHMSTALVEREDDGISPDIQSVISRFAPQTGQVSEETDKHMYDIVLQASILKIDTATDAIRMAYIDSEMAKRSHQNQKLLQSDSDDRTLSSTGALLNVDIHRQPAAVGKLHEIDLGPDATLRNIARTEAAISGDGKQAAEPPRPPPKPRIGRNGKLYTPRPRKRRNSADVARDRIVEDVLRETRLDIYDDEIMPPPAGTAGVEDDQAADDRIAEQFRRDFLDAITQRRKRAKQAPGGSGSGGAKGKVADERPKGPKLGGSRSARAAMREREEAANKAQKKR